MIKIKKVVALSVGLIMSASLFTGCSTDGLALMNVFSKSQTINSMQSQTDISVKVSGSNMSAHEQEMMSTILPMINGTKISMLTKTNQNKEKTIAKMQSDMVLQLGQMPNPINMSVWVDVDTTGKKPVLNEVIKMPQLLSSQLPKELQGKDYMVMNLADMTNAPGMPQADYNKLMSFSKEFQPKFLDFMVKYAKQFNPTTNYIKHVGSQSFLENSKKQSIDIYEIKLSDKSFKDLMHYTLNNLTENTDAMNFVKEYMTSMMSVYDLTDAQVKSSQDEMNKAFDNLTIQWPQQLASLNKALGSLDNLKILGDNGITIRYTVNADGYIINEKGNAEFVVDIPGIIKLVGNSEKASTPNNPTGRYTIGIAFNTDMTNINGDVDIVFPKVNSTNSFNYTDIMKMISTELPTK
ncbi:hypothetical protein G9F72_011120 [Clostridium estertheticum]|uniref:hypothetical protein n=1 Tax=Clostridium estertheticum TaxID=238834 RepID=UPI0013E8F681|nr:hypothetical protein [Clostridium estertheticum]MBZ9686876.1 hypothetical protein [Clostridium estertheticum]